MKSDQLKSLLTLQKKDLTLIQLKKEARLIPVKQKELQEKARSEQERAKKAQEDVQACESDIRQVAGDVESMGAQINKYKTQQMQAKTNEEYKAFEKEIATAREKISALEDQELEHMSRLEELSSEKARALEAEKTAMTKVEEDVKELEQRLEVIRSTFADVKATREDHLNQIEDPVTARYLQLLNKNQNAVVVPVRQQCCGGCHMKLTPQVLHDAHSQQKWTACTHCGRYVYDESNIT